MILCPITTLLPWICKGRRRKETLVDGPPGNVNHWRSKYLDLLGLQPNKVVGIRIVLATAVNDASEVGLEGLNSNQDATFDLPFDCVQIHRLRLTVDYVIVIQGI